VTEGASSATAKLFINHLKYAYASSQELEVLLMLCLKLKFISDDVFHQLFDDLDRFKSATFKLIANTERKDAQKRFAFLNDDVARGK
jgi:four helix bundle protein